MKVSSEGDGSSKARGERCAECGAGLSATQRYCLECGNRCGPLPAVIAKRVDALRKRERPGNRNGGGASAAAAAVTLAQKGKAPEEKGRWDFMPSPQVAAVAVMALLAAGVVLGSVTSPLAQSAGVASIIL
ncbi:MAG TPA: hypothetical protein VN756_13150, partial [Solirubrobacterales bacterium]|nr:hypothetical protein [Solirubrobacterales bacterium]